VETRAAIGLGSNVGDRAGHIRWALAELDRLPGAVLLSASGLYESPALVKPGASPGGLFLNAAAVVRTVLPARALLGAMLEIEARRGRDRTGPARSGPRTLDLDLLLYGRELVEEPGLRVPHPGLRDRLFVLVPLAEIAAGMPVPPGPERVADLLGAAAARAREGGTYPRPWER